ncbi:hypothetical protein D9M71_264430 [compost metagenome]
MQGHRQRFDEGGHLQGKVRRQLMQNRAAVYVAHPDQVRQRPLIATHADHRAVGHGIDHDPHAGPVVDDRRAHLADDPGELMPQWHRCPIAANAPALIEAQVTPANTARGNFDQHICLTRGW